MPKLTKPQKALYEALNPLQQRTANAYIDNQSRSYRECYLIACAMLDKKPSKSPKQSGEQVLSSIAVRAYLDSVLKPKAEKAAESAIMSREESLERLTAMARGNISDLIEFTSTGWKFKNSEELTPEILALINKVSESKEGMKIEIHSPQAAHKQLALLQGWESAQKHDINARLDGRMTVIVKNLMGAPPNADS